MNDTVNIGFYLLGEFMALREAADSDQGLALFARYGFANEDINQYQHYIGAGVAPVAWPEDHSTAGFKNHTLEFTMTACAQPPTAP